MTRTTKTSSKLKSSSPCSCPKCLAKRQAGTTKQPPKAPERRFVNIEALRLRQIGSLIYPVNFDVRLHLVEGDAWSVFDVARRRLGTEEGREFFDLLVVDGIAVNPRIRNRGEIAAVAGYVAASFEWASSLHVEADLALSRLNAGDGWFLENLVRRIFKTVKHDDPTFEPPAIDDAELARMARWLEKLRGLTVDARSMSTLIRALDKRRNAESADFMFVRPQIHGRHRLLPPANFGVRA